MAQETEKEVETEVETETAPEATAVETETALEARQEYDVHFKVPIDMCKKLRDCAELAYRMGDIPKPKLVNLMNLYIGWGIEIQKKKWLPRVGYR